MPQRATAPVWRTTSNGTRQRYHEAVGPRSTVSERQRVRGASVSRAREARSYLEDLGVTITGGTAAQFKGHRDIDLDVNNLRIDVERLQDQALRVGLRTVPRNHVQRWVDKAATVIEREERDALDAEMVERFGYHTNITHTADIDPADVDRFTDDFNLALRERWAEQGIPADMPDEYFDALR